jgi:regulator of RNase E activity RraA
MPQTDIIRPPRHIVDGFSGIGTAIIASMMRSEFNILRHVAVGLHTLTPGRHAVGTAVTLQFLPRREDIVSGTQEEAIERRSALWASIMAVEEGDTLVVDARGHMQTGVAGEMLMTGIHARGGRGLVADGCIRDYAPAREIGLPIFARGATPANAGFFELYPWDYNVPVGCGNILIMPGDIVVADDDGVIVIPPSIAEELLALCQSKTESEVFEKLMISRTGNVAKYHPLSQEGRREYEAWVAAGRPMDPSWQPPKA